jgi:predicted Zn-dependent peptidase
MPSRTGNGAETVPQFGAGVKHETRDIAQHHFMFGFPGVSSSDPRRYTYEVLSSLLGGGFTSRLFSKIREDEGLAYSINAFNHCYRGSGMLGVYAAVAPENLARTLELAMGEFRDIREHAVPEAELDMNREQLKSSYLMGLESTFNRMARMAKSMLHRGRILTIEEVMQGFDAVTAADISQIAEEVFHGEQCAMAVLEHDQFRVCSDCDRVYWRGSHYDRLARLLEEILDSNRPLRKT